MPLRATPKPSKLGGGRKTVAYRNAAGETEEALVVGPGSVSGLELCLVNRRPRVYLDNVALATTVKGTNVYFDRW
jgi:hypothetical protein